MTSARYAAVADAVAGELEGVVAGAVVRGAPSADLVTSRVGGPIGVLVRAEALGDLEAVAAAADRHGVPVAVIGRGSNLLVADGGFDGIGVVLGGAFEAIDVGETTVVAGGAVALPVLARRSAAAGRAGLEFYVGIPGSVGGAVRMNAGGHGRETADVLLRAWLFDLGGGGVVERAVADLGLRYRHSEVPAGSVVVRAELAVAPDDPGACEARIDEVVRWRREHQPGGANAGSVFTNPPGDSAGRLIDSCGLKGLRVGGAEVSTKHANFIQTGTAASAADVVRLIAEVRDRVAAATGVRLVPEVRLLGFDAGDPPNPDEEQR
ncbi:MAG: UDP-N-acetylmuramate dehydrogenase [Acidimicrobiia bacterium]